MWFILESYIFSQQYFGGFREIISKNSHSKLAENVYFSKYKVSVFGTGGLRGLNLKLPTKSGKHTRNNISELFPQEKLSSSRGLQSTPCLQEYIYFFVSRAGF